VSRRTSKRRLSALQSQSERGNRTRARARGVGIGLGALGLPFLCVVVEPAWWTAQGGLSTWAALLGLAVVGALLALASTELMIKVLLWILLW
jgi:hypothetical protein